jgi:sterol desaturase/sphingolipid hydroxylase (fatty acid hydroxylase superfamily)
MVSMTLLSVAAACPFLEFVGYWLHMLLHSEKIEFLSRNHMIHHLVVYAPNKPMRQSQGYLGSTYARASVLGIGMEWLVPAAILLSATLLAFRLLGLAALYQTVFVATSLAWGYLMFGYMHDGMHIQGFWMEESDWLGRWFLKARRLHDIHHMELEDDGREAKNFGICFFFFDRLFGSLSTEHKRFNHKGLEAAKKRYAYIYA